MAFTGEATIAVSANPSLIDRIQCPCEHFTAMSKIVTAIGGEQDSSDSNHNNDTSMTNMTGLLDWLNGTTDDLALRDNKLLSCGKRSRCRFRYGTSFAILNAIRDACRYHLEQQQQQQQQESGTVTSVPTDEGAGVTNTVPQGKSQSSQQQSSRMEPYEDAFPPLMSTSHDSTAISLKKEQEPELHPATANILIPRKKQAANKIAARVVKGTSEATITVHPPTASQPKNKRRIRPALVTHEGPTNFWQAQSTSVSLSTSHSNNKISNNRTGHTGTGGVWGPRNTNTPATTASTNPLSSSTAIESLDSIKKSLDFTTISSEIIIRSEESQSHAITSPLSSNPATTVTPLLQSGKHPRDVNCSASPPHILESLVTVYVTLFQNMLVPSTPLELHFLIRLLAIDEGSQISNPNHRNKTEPTPFFQSLFSTGRDCHLFAVQTLTKLKSVLLGLPIQVLRKLVQSASVQHHCADLVEELTVLLDKYQQDGLPMLYPTEAITGTRAILSLPFEDKRDSRHHYKTLAEIAVYQNREESRDLFLHELRTFMGSKGKAFRPQDMERSQDRVRQKARDLMNGLLTVNMMWFAQFYCDLLLQVGFAPVQEMDQELLTITDEDKLQKLHKRFASRSSHTSKSSKKISVSKRGGPTSHYASARLPIDEAHQLFTGYQEFFFLFLHELAFNFGFHLRGRMAKTILESLSDLSHNDLEKKVMKLQLLSRFLGYLVFSPNWHEAAIDNAKNQSLDVCNGLEQLESLGLSLALQVRKAWTAGYLIGVIPWVTELLRMAKWDSCTQASPAFRWLLADLRFVQEALSCPEDSATCGFAPSMQIIVFCLERFFDDTYGLPRLTSLPPSNLGILGNDPNTKWIDGYEMGFSTVLLFASSPNVEDLLSLVDQTEIGSTNKSSLSKARKLRASVVSLSLEVEPSRFVADEENGLFPTPVKARRQDSNDILSQSDNRSIESRLVEGFFHQHRNLKEISEFVVGQVLRNYSRHIVPDCVREILASEGNIPGKPETETLAKYITLAHEKVELTLTKTLEEKIGQALVLLGPCDADDSIITIATRLSVSAAMNSVQPTLHSVIARQLEEVQRTGSTSLQSSRGVGDTTTAAIAALDNITSLFRTAIEDPLPSSGVVVGIQRACSCLQALRRESEASVPGEATLRVIVSALLRLDKASHKILRWCDSLPDESFLETSLVLIRLILAVSDVSSYGLPTLVRAIDGTFVSRALKGNGQVKGGAEMLELLQELFEKNIIDSIFPSGEEKSPQDVNLPDSPLL